MKEQIKVVCWACKQHIYNFIGDYPKADDIMTASSLEPASNNIAQPYNGEMVECPFCSATGFNCLTYPWSYQREMVPDISPVTYQNFEVGRIFKYFEVV